MYVKIDPFGYLVYGGRRAYKEVGIEDPTKYMFPMGEKYPTYYDHEHEERNRSKNKTGKGRKK